MKTRIGWAATLLILVSPLSIVSGYLTDINSYAGVWCGRAYRLGGPTDHLRTISLPTESDWETQCLRYTREYQGIVNYSVSGVFQQVRTENRTGASEIVFTLQNNTVGMLRLIFYCKGGAVVTTSDTGSGISGGYEFCENVPFENGAFISIHGTLITPSQWNPELSTPTLAFTGDLYVMEAEVQNLS
jgi:hypothetical protein